MTYRHRIKVKKKKAVKPKSLNPCPVDNAGLISQLFYWWIFPLYRKKNSHLISDGRLYDVPKELSSQILGDRLADDWNNELLLALDGKRKLPLMIMALWKTFGPSMVVLTMSRTAIEACLVGLVLLVEDMVEEPNNPDNLYYGLAVCALLGLYLLLHQGWTNLAMTIGIQMRLACFNLLHRKILKLDLFTARSAQVQQLLSSIQGELPQVDQLAVSLPYIITGPLTAAVVYFILWDFLGATCLVGMTFLCVLIPLQILIGRYISQLSREAASVTDRRLWVLREVGLGLAQIKQCAWEKSFLARAEEARSNEAQILQKASFLHIFICVAFSQATKIMALLAITTFVLLGNELALHKAFLTLCAIHALRIPLCKFFPLAISIAYNLKATVENLQEFLLLRECEGVREQRCQETVPSSYSVAVRDVSTKWNLHSRSNFALSHVYLCAQQGELVCVVGPVDAGKSSFILLLAGELYATSGSVSIYGHTAYSSPQPWIFQGTIRKNITCGSPFNEEAFKVVLTICELSEDVATMPREDLATIGSGGEVVLTSSQMARINLARTLYQEADIYLLDSPLLLMEEHTAEIVFKKAILQFLKQKTVILATDRSTLLSNSQQILVLKDGVMEGCGSHQELAATGLELYKFVEHDRPRGMIPLQRSESGDITISDSMSIESLLEETISGEMTDDSNDNTVSERHISTTSWKGLRSSVLYMKTGGKTRLLFVIIFTWLCFQSLTCTWDYCFLVWTLEDDINSDVFFAEMISVFNAPQSFYVYILWLVLIVLLALSLVAFICMHHVHVSSATTLHKKLLHSFINAPVSIMDKNMQNEYLNAFSFDMRVIDEHLPPTLMQVTQYVMIMLGCIITVGLANYWLLIPMVVLLCVAVLVGCQCLPTTGALQTIEVKRMKCIEGNILSTLEGLPTIRGLQAEEFFKEEFSVIQDKHASALYLLESSTNALCLWLGLVSLANMACITFSFLLFGDELKPAYLGLGMYSSLVLTDLVPETVAYCVRAAKQLSSVLSVCELCGIQQEESVTCEETLEKLKCWPQCGEIIVENLSLVNKLNVLQNVSFVVKAGEKIGVVGCMGAGKSELMTALLRMAHPPASGIIIIDCVDINTVPLQFLRSKISVVPRNPIIFSGVFQWNLDMSGENPDMVLWDALEKVGLKSMIQMMEYGIQTESQEWNKVFTTHQRQLICLARAIVAQNKILLLDMNTVDLDKEHEVTMLDIVSKHFNGCTVIIISHRLRSVMKSDRILVLESGKMTEFGHPYLLLQNKYSRFYKMVEQTGEIIKEQLRNLAKEAYFNYTTD